MKGTEYFVSLQKTIDIPSSIMLELTMMN